VITVSFIACSGAGEKKVVVMASGNLTVTDKIIKIEPSLRHNEEELILKGEKITLTVQGEAGGDKNFDLTDNGVYLLNLQSDTLIGGLVNYGATGMPGSITGEQLDHIIDSTKQLMEGLNANDAKGTFFLLPLSIKKITAKNNAKIIGSFKGIPYKIEPDNSGNIPEVFKFFTTRQKRETLNDLMQQKAKIKNMH
jgi:hypothetical protein